MCKFLDEELEAGKITRIQEYTPPFKVCKLDYIGKITLREEDNEQERYLAFIYSGNKDPGFPPETKVYGPDGKLIPNDKVIERLREGMIADYRFKERDKEQKPTRVTGLLVELKVRP